MNGDLARLLDGLEEAIAERRPYDGPIPQGGILPTLIAELRRRDEALAGVRELADDLGAEAMKFRYIERAGVALRIYATLAAHTERSPR